MKCSVCKIHLTEVYSNPLGAGEIYCWYHADYFYIWHSDRFEAAQKKHKDIPIRSESDLALSEALRDF